MTTSLVTGGNGYFGELLVQRLLARGDDVRLLVVAAHLLVVYRRNTALAVNSKEEEVRDDEAHTSDPSFDLSFFWAHPIPIPIPLRSFLFIHCFHSAYSHPRALTPNIRRWPLSLTIV